jgi:hypothetical protein
MTAILEALTDTQRRRLAGVIAAGAPAPDRVAAVEFAAPAVDRDSLTGVVEGWLHRAAPNPAVRTALVDRLAGVGHPLGAALRPVTLREDGDVPAWAAALTEFLLAQPEQRCSNTRAAGAPHAAFRRAARALLPHADGAVLGVAVTADAWADIAGVLDRRLVEACNLTFCQEMQIATGSALPDWSRWDGIDISRPAWLDRLERVPALAHVIGTVCLQWRDAFTELFTRLATDLPLLASRLWDGAEPGALSGLRGDAGDRHAGGRSVALLQFSGGRSVAYKPKDMAHAAGYMALIDFLNARGADLATRVVLPRHDGVEDYGWEEVIAADPCADASGFARFYTRLGMLIRLAQLLEGRDLWADNLIASGDQPHLIDLECLLYPRVQPPPSVPAERRPMLDALEATVVRTAMAVQPWVPSKDRPVVDIGCLSRIGDALDEAGNPLLPLPPYRPCLPDGTPADPWAYTAEVQAGYRRMHALLTECSSELPAVLEAFRGVWVRYIWRHTWDGYKIIKASVSPRALVDGPAREAVLAGALRGVLTALTDRTDRDDLVRVVLAEIDSFRVLDIPLFRSRTDSDAVFTADGREIPGHFQGTAWDRLMARVAALAEFDLDSNLDVLGGCLDAARSATATPTPVSATEPISANLLELAVRLGDDLLAARHDGGWIAASWYPLTGLRQVEVAGIDLISGTGAVAMLLAELWAATGEARFFRAARSTLLEASDLVGQSTAYATDTRLAGGVPVLGGFAGPGALIHALAHSSDLLREPDLATRAQNLVAALPGDSGGFADLPGGRAGLLANLLRLRRTTGPGHAATDETIAELARRSVLDLADPAARFARHDQVRDLAPTGRDSVAMVLRRALSVAPDLVDASQAEAALAAWRPDLDTRGGRLATSTANSPRGPRTCTDLVATAGELLTAGLDADPVIAELVARRERHGRWFADRPAADRVNLGGLDGSVAVGLLMLRRIDPRTANLPVLD